jgi:hypothetical protein
MGSPPQPTTAQYAQLEGSGRLEMMGKPETVHLVNGAGVVKFNLPRRGVSLLVFDLN